MERMNPRHSIFPDLQRMTTIRTTALFAILALAACGGSGGAASDERAGADEAAAAVQAAPAAPRSHVFDPARVRVGDSIAGMRVDSVAVQQTPDGDWVGTVRFTGEARVGGTYEPHPDTDVDALCFFASAEHTSRLPRFTGDERKPWFCFENQDRARALLHVPPDRGRAEILIESFAYHVNNSDAVNEARLRRVLTRVPLAQGREGG